MMGETKQREARMSYYFVAQIKIKDTAEYAKYEAGFLEIFAKYEGEALVVDNDPSVVEGDWDFTRMVVLRFPNRDLAESWYKSEAYQKLMRHRLNASGGVVIGAAGLGS